MWLHWRPVEVEQRLTWCFLIPSPSPLACSVLILNDPQFCFVFRLLLCSLAFCFGLGVPLFLFLSLSLFPSPALAFYLCILVCSEQTLISCNLLVANVARQQVERFRRFITQKFTSNGQKQGRRWWRRRWVRRWWCRRRRRRRQCKQYLCYATNDLIVSLKDFIIKLDI